MEKTITSKNIGKEIIVEGEIFREKGNLYIVKGYTRARILNPEIFCGEYPDHILVKGVLTISLQHKYPEFAIEVEKYEARAKG